MIYADIACTRCKLLFVLVTAAHPSLSVIDGRFVCASCGHAFSSERDVPRGQTPGLFSGAGCLADRNATNGTGGK